MTKLEQLQALREAQKELMKVYSSSENGEHRIALTRIIREKIGPVVFDLTNEVEQEEGFPKTVRELSDEYGIDRSTLLKAAQQCRIPARRSGKTWLIDDESDIFKQWLVKHSSRIRTSSFGAKEAQEPYIV
jgi:hypothetical protein